MTREEKEIREISSIAYATWNEHISKKIMNDKELMSALKEITKDWIGKSIYGEYEKYYNKAIEENFIEIKSILEKYKVNTIQGINDLMTIKISEEFYREYFGDSLDEKNSDFSEIDSWIEKEIDFEINNGKDRDNERFSNLIRLQIMLMFGILNTIEKIKAYAESKNIKQLLDYISNKFD